MTSFNAMMTSYFDYVAYPPIFRSISVSICQCFLSSTFLLFPRSKHLPFIQPRGKRGCLVHDRKKKYGASSSLYVKTFESFRGYVQYCTKCLTLRMHRHHWNTSSVATGPRYPKYLRPRTIDPEPVTLDQGPYSVNTYPNKIFRPAGWQ